MFFFVEFLLGYYQISTTWVLSINYLVLDLVRFGDVSLSLCFNFIIFFRNYKIIYDTILEQLNTDGRGEGAVHLKFLFCFFFCSSSVLLLFFFCSFTNHPLVHHAIHHHVMQFDNLLWMIRD